MDKQQMQKILIPAAAIAGVILLVGLIVATGGSSKPEPGGPSGPKGKPGTDTEGMTNERPPLDAPEWKPLSDGIKYWDVTVGDGAQAVTAGDTPIMHYTGWRATDGVVFDSSVGKGVPLDMPLSQLISGWKVGVPGMKPGGIRRLFIPAAMGYGARGSGEKIPPNTDLVFEMKLLRIGK
jgi:FKBP-type peptidyl-prolyl cis-trans isomerase